MLAMNMTDYIDKYGVAAAGLDGVMGRRKIVRQPPRRSSDEEYKIQIARNAERRDKMNIKELGLYENWANLKMNYKGGPAWLSRTHSGYQVKPSGPLPWYETQMRESMGRLSSRIMELKVCPRCHGNLTLERGMDGLSKRCIQCSFEIELVPPPGAESHFARLRQSPAKAAVLHHV